MKENFSVKNKTQSKDLDYSDHNVKLTFYITYVFLMTTATITFIEAIRTNDSKVRHILNIETCISVVAAFFYSKFVTDIEERKKNDIPLDYKEIIVNRYTDWMITTPLMLLVLCLAFAYNSKTTLNFFTFLLILLLNFGMIISGFVGEIGYIKDLQTTNLVGFAFFLALYGFIYYRFLYKKYNFDNLIIFLSFFILWSFYGVFYMYDNQFRNVGYNVLDLLSKCFVGIFFWAYFTKVFTLN
jgi:bacteriorhodopsin|tara:strand:- start:687 stop:1409 length:723 start_codon:yes stop_codon:yes gene_type:complete